MSLDLSDEEAAALERLLRDTIDARRAAARDLFEPLCPSVPFLKWSYKKRCTNAIVGVPIGGSWLWRVKGSSWLRKRLKN